MVEEFFNVDNDQEKGNLNPIYLYVGIALCVVALAAVIIWVVVPSASTLPFSIEFSDAGLLTEGAPVSFKGVEIGKVKEISIQTTGAALVKVTIDRKYSGLLRQGSIFRIQSDAAGSTYIQGITLDPVSPPLTKKSTVVGAATYLEYLEQAAIIKGQEYLRKLTLGVIDTRTTVKKSNEIEQRIILVTGELIPADLLFSGILPDDDTWTREEQLSEGYNVIKLDGVFSSPNQAAWADSTITLSPQESFFFNEYTFEQVFPPDSFQTKIIDANEGLDTPDFAEIGVKIVFCILDPSHVACSTLLENISDIPALIRTVIKGLSDQIGEVSAVPLERVEVNIVLEVPGKVLSHNGFELTSKGVAWYLTGEDLNNGIVLSAVYRVWTPWVFVVGGLVLLLISGSIYFFVYQKNKGTDYPDEPDSIF